MCFIMFFYELYASSFFFHQTSISCLPFTGVLFSHWYVHHVRSHSLATDSMAKIKRECTFMLLEHYISLWAPSALLEMEDSGGEVPRAWSWGSELCYWLSSERKALSKVVDRVIKMCVKDINPFLTLCCPAWLLWRTIDSGVKPLQSHGSLCSGSTDDKSFSETARARTNIHKHKRAKLLRDTRLEAPVTHANETGPASSRQHGLILHCSASLQKPKSFSPPSPVIVTPMERRSGNHLFSHTVRGASQTTLHMRLFLALEKSLTNSNIVSGTWHMQWTKTHLQGHRVLFNPEEVSDPSENVQGCKMQGCNSDISSLSFRSVSQL